MSDPIDLLAEMRADRERVEAYKAKRAEQEPATSRPSDPLGQSWYVMHNLLAHRSDAGPVEAPVDDLAALTQVGVDALRQWARPGDWMAGDPVRVSRTVVRAVLAALDIDEAGEPRVPRGATRFYKIVKLPRLRNGDLSEGLKVGDRVRVVGVDEDGDLEVELDVVNDFMSVSAECLEEL